jgi:hypothetical protein
MNRNILIGTAIAAGAAAVFYLIKRKRKAADGLQQVPVRRGRHLINVFSKAKQHIPA